MSELMRAFKVSNEKGQAKWQQTRNAVMRRRAEADAFAKAQEVEAERVLKYVRPRRAKYVKEWAERTFAEKARA